MLEVDWVSIFLIWPAVVAWLIARAYRQQGLLRTIEPALTTTCAAESVTIIIPARDEESNIDACVQTILAQDYPRERFDVIVVDDHSCDSTLQIARSIAKQSPQMRVVESPLLPSRWVGKSHACWIGARAAPPDAEWLCFIDADMRADPNLMSSAISLARSSSVDVLSLAPRHELVSFAERLIIPCGLYCLSFCRDLRKVQSDTSQDATVTGQFLLVRRRLYDAVGGHAAIHEFVAEDVALARLMKRSGARVELCDGRELLSTRMYTGWKTLWPGLSKNLTDVLGGPVQTAAVAAIGFLLAWAVWLVPIAATVKCIDGASTECFAMAAAVAGSAAAIGLHVAGTSYFNIPFWYGLLFPIAYTAGIAMTIDSIQQRLRRRVQWKGRFYPGKPM